jgi:hypothetical protein
MCLSQQKISLNEYHNYYSIKYYRLAEFIPSFIRPLILRFPVRVISPWNKNTQRMIQPTIYFSKKRLQQHHTLRALVPAYCLLITSPLLAHICWVIEIKLFGASGDIRPNLISWDIITSRAIEVWNKQMITTLDTKFSTILKGLLGRDSFDLSNRYNLF